VPTATLTAVPSATPTDVPTAARLLYLRYSDAVPTATTTAVPSAAPSAVPTGIIDILFLLTDREGGNTALHNNNTTSFYNKYFKIVNHPNQESGVGGNVHLPYIHFPLASIYHIHILTHGGRGRLPKDPPTSPLLTQKLSRY